MALVCLTPGFSCHSSSWGYDAAWHNQATYADFVPLKCSRQWMSTHFMHLGWSNFLGSIRSWLWVLHGSFQNTSGLHMNLGFFPSLVLWVQKMGNTHWVPDSSLNSSWVKMSALSIKGTLQTWNFIIGWLGILQNTETDISVQFQKGYFRQTQMTTAPNGICPAIWRKYFSESQLVQKYKV